MEEPAELKAHLPSFRLDGKLALITGAGAGLGAAIGIGFAEAGAQVVLVARTRSDLEQVKAKIESNGGHASVAVCDITDTEVLRKTIAGLPRLDVLVNNAGTNYPNPIADMKYHELQLMLDLNVRAVYVACQEGVRKMREDPRRRENGGVIINMSSQMGHVGSPNRTAYCMTKHAVEGLTKALGVELAPENIRVNSIAPTFVDTPLVRRVVDTPEKKNFVMSRIAMGRLASVEDVMGAALFLASPAAAMVTGTSIVVDGGWTAQ